MKIISDSLESISQTNSKLNYTIDSNDNQSFVVFHNGIDYENNLPKSPQLQYQKQSKIADNESDSLPIPWIAAIIINAILVFLFIVFVIYCYWKSRKRRRRIRNPDKDSLFSSKSSKHSVQEVQNMENKGITNETITKDNIFNIENEHKRLTEDNGSPTLETNRKTSLKSPMTKVRSVTRLSSGPRGSTHESNTNGNHYYNPTDSPSVSKFTNNLNDFVPNQSQYKAKHEEEDEDQQLEPLTETEDDNYEVNDTSTYVQIEPKQDNFEKISLKERQTSPSRVKTPSPIKQMPSSPSRGMNPSITTATNILTKIKDMTPSPRKSASPERRVRTPGSQHSSHSTAVQTSPNTSWANIPGAVAEDRYIDERTISLRGDTEKKYFLYIIKDVNPFTKKECVGRITLPRQRMTLEQLRHYLLQSDDETIRNLAKRKFKFLSESYRLVVMNESFTPVDQIYQTQGIFIKFSAGDSVPFAYRSQNKFRANRNAVQSNNYENRSKSQLDSVTRSSRNLTLTTDSIYGSTSRSIQRKDSIYGSTYGTTPKSNQKSIYGSILKSTDKSRFGYENSYTKRDERKYTIDRTPRRRDERESMITSPQSMITTPIMSQMVSPRTRVRLCRKIQLQAQVESGQLEEMPNFITSSLDSVCDNKGCTNKPLLKCFICSKVNYCSPQCKREHWSEHRFICKKPPWKG